MMDSLASDKESRGRLAQRRQLNKLMTEHQQLEQQNQKLREHFETIVQELADVHDNFMKETQRLKDTNRDLSQRLENVEEINKDKIVSLEQRVVTQQEEMTRLKEQILHEREKYHQLTVDYAQVQSALNHLKDNFNEENTEWSEYVTEMEKQLTIIQEKMSENDTNLQTVQREKQQLVTEKEMAEQETQRYKEKLDKKQKNCDELLDQMHLWRAQYESAQSDYIHERNIREKEAIAVQALRQNRDALQREVKEFRTRITDLSMENEELKIVGKSQQLTVNYEQTRSVVCHHDEQNTEWSDYVAEMEKQLTIIQEKMSENDTNLQTVQREKQQLKEMAEQETQRYKEKLDKKQKNCDELLDQMHLWREQYESAQSDYIHERNIREKEAIAVQALRQNRDALQREVKEFRTRITDLSMENEELKIVGKSQQLTVNYEQTRSVVCHHDEQNTEWSDYVAEMEKQLAVIQEKMSAKDTNLQIVQREKQQLVTEKEMAEQEILRYKEKLDKKQKNCDELLDQMHLWREQYESAQSDYIHERNIREKEAVAKLTLRQNRDALQREVKEWRKRLTTGTRDKETQTQLLESDTRLKVTQSQLLKSDTRLKETQRQLQESNSRLKDTQVQLQVAQQNFKQQIQDFNRQVKENDQNTQQIQQDILHLRETTQRKEDTIREQQEEIRRLKSQIENPYWALQKDEVEMTNEILGKGGWGEVKVAIFRGTKVAAKCLHEVIIAEHNLHLFSREMDVASRVRHPNLLQFIGATRVGNPIILTELMPTSLRKELEKGPLTHPQILMISRDVSTALNYLHLWKPQPILHRDVSSANVLLEPSVNRRWKGKLCDYGSANFLHQVSTVAPGSPVYSAPEALSPHLHSPAMDVYSFGILLLEMATCRLPSTISFEREGQICEVQYPSIKALVERCTRRDPQLRPKIQKVLEDINAI